MFLVSIIDLPDSIKSTVRLFADDTIAYRASNEDCARLQKDLDEIVEWERRWEWNVILISVKFSGSQDENPQLVSPIPLKVTL